MLAGELREMRASKGVLSLGDRACIATRNHARTLLR